MKRIIFIFLFLPFLTKGQSYQQLTDSALHTMWKGKDSITVALYYPKAYELYKQAFKAYPNAIEKIALYKVGVLAGELGFKQEAFKYLNKAVEMQEWQMILGKYASEEFSSLVGEPQWPSLRKKAQIVRGTLLNKLMRDQQQLEGSSIRKRLKLKNVNAVKAYSFIKKFDNYPDVQTSFLSLSLKINDTLQTPYLVCLPKNYNRHKKYALLVSLHGGVLNTSGFPEYMDSTDIGEWSRYYTKYAERNNVIMVYPNGDREFNWMSPDRGFFMVPTIIKYVKAIINIDDNRVFVTGHSNGATGSFSYLMKQPSPFAAFYGFNTRPKVATGGTYIRNILNRSYFNISTDQDYYFPPEANDSLTILMKKIGADYQDHRYNGFPHWFPAFDESAAAHELLFKDLVSRKRNPFKPTLYWECDDVKYGRCDWLQITSLNNSAEHAGWQKNLNFDIKKWKSYDAKDSLITRDTLLKAFKYDNFAGALRAYYRDNVFEIHTSAVKSLSIYISPEMINMNKKVTVMIDGKLKFNGMVAYNKKILLEEFSNSIDRKAIWVNKIDLTVN
jgi:dienelactone hydrolase